MPPSAVHTTSMVRGDGTFDVADFSQLDSPTNPPSQLFKAVILDTVARQDVLKKSEKSRQDALKIQSDESIENVHRKQARQFAAAVEIKKAEEYLNIWKENYEAREDVHKLDEANLADVRKYWIHGESEWGAGITLLEENLQYRAAVLGLDPEAMITCSRLELESLKRVIAKKERDLRRLKAQYNNKGDAQLLWMKGEPQARD